MSIEKRSNTNIPCFDINFPVVLSELGEQEITGEIIENNLDKITKLFAIKDKINSILEINNQSLRPLIQAYPDLQDTEELQESRESIIEKVQHQDERTNVKFRALKVANEKDSEFIGKSSILTIGTKRLVIMPSNL